MTDEAYNLFQSKFNIWELIVGALVPLSVVVVGLFVNRGIKKLESELQRSQSLITKRVEIFENLRAPLNRIFCACYYVGDWRKVTPPEVLAAKRTCDEIFFSHIAFWSQEVALQYRAFNDVCFAAFRGKGLHAVLLADVENYVQAFGDTWNDSWRANFVTVEEREAWLKRHNASAKPLVDISYSQDIVLPRYAALMKALAEDFGAKSSDKAIIEAMARRADDDVKK